MTLLERVGQLVRSNLNDLVDRAEDPEKMVKQLMLDLHDQRIRVKAQLAVALTEQYLVRERASEARAAAVEWMRKAELAVDHGDDGLATRALARHNAHAQTVQLFEEQEGQHKSDVERLRDALTQLDTKMEEAEGKAAVLISEHRVARARARVGQTTYRALDADSAGALNRMDQKIREEDAHGTALFQLVDDDLESTFARLEQAQQLEKQLGELKARRETR